jgi:hypothetical protein
LNLAIKSKSVVSVNKRKGIIQDLEAARSSVHTLHLSPYLPESNRNEQIVKEIRVLELEYGRV